LTDKAEGGRIDAGTIAEETHNNITMPAPEERTEHYESIDFDIVPPNKQMNATLQWQSRLQTETALSTMEAEVIDLAACMRELIIWKFKQDNSKFESSKTIFSKYLVVFSTYKVVNTKRTIRCFQNYILIAQNYILNKTSYIYDTLPN
jgi:Flp pilus assembly protein TadG